LFTGATLKGEGGLYIVSQRKRSGRLGGGTLGPDLTAVNTKSKDPELIGILQNPNFPTMKSVFGARPLADEEIVQLFAYFQNAKLTQPGAQVNPGIVRLDPWFVAVGFVLALLSVWSFSLIWRNRLQGVREPIVSAAAKSHKRHKDGAGFQFRGVPGMSSTVKTFPFGSARGSEPERHSETRRKQ
jgi:hypothetical protein